MKWGIVGILLGIGIGISLMLAGWYHALATPQEQGLFWEILGDILPSFMSGLTK